MKVMNKLHLKMASDGDCSTRQDWCDLVNDENLPNTNPNKVGRKYEHFRGNGTHYGQAKEQLEEELTRLALVTSENRLLLRQMQTCFQEADDELRLALTLLRADLQQNHNDSMLRKDVLDWEVMEQRIIGSLTELGECQENLKSIKCANLTQLFKVLTQTPRGQVKEMSIRSPKLCYYCLEEGHLIKECPHRKNSEMWKQTQAFKRKIAFRHKQKVDEMHSATSVSWTGEEGNDEDVITTRQSIRENAIVSHNPLS